MARILFLHRYFPGQYRYLAPALARNPAHHVVFLAREGTADLAGVERRTYRPSRPPHRTTHEYLASFEEAVLDGQAAYRACAELRSQGFVPDAVCAHSGFGPALYVKEIFPTTPLIGYFEWLYRGPARDSEHLTGKALDVDVACRARTRNAAILMDLAACDVAVTPTQFQRQQFPSPFADRLQVLHDGVDTDFFTPAPPDGRLESVAGQLPGDAEILTYATRGMEPYRGFEHFMAAAAALIEKRPRLHVVVAGEDIVAYSEPLPDGETYRQRALARHPNLACERVHFVGHQTDLVYRDLLRSSSVHVYLTVPFVLSWSLLEAMATGCLVVGADTAPVREVMRDGETGLLVDFRDPAALERRIAEALDHADALAPLRRNAREKVERDYALQRLLPRHVELVEDLASRASPLTRLAVAGDPASIW